MVFSYGNLQGFLDIRWAKWKRVLLTRSVAIVPCVVIAIVARNSLDYLDNYINVEQSLLVSRGHSQTLDNDLILSVSPSLSLSLSLSLHLSLPHTHTYSSSPSLSFLCYMPHLIGI
jgi:hypothetical protein